MSGPAESVSVALVVLVVVGVDAAERLPRMQNRALLRVPLGELVVVLAVPAALVAVVPEEDAGVVHVAPDHLADESLARRRVVATLPPAQLVEHVQTQLVAGFEEVRVRRVVRHPYGVVVHLFEQTHIVVADLPARRAPRLRPERVTVRALQDDPLAVEVEPIASAHLEGAEAETLGENVRRPRLLRQSEPHAIEVGRLRCPELRRDNLRLESDPFLMRIHPRAERLADSRPVRIEDLCRHLARRRGGARAQVHVHRKTSIGPRVNRRPVNEGRRQRFEIDRAEDTAEDPVVGAETFGAVHALIRRHLTDGDFQKVRLSVFQQRRDVVPERVEGALMRGAGGLAVDPDLSVGHHAVEDEADDPATPVSRNGKL